MAERIVGAPTLAACGGPDDGDSISYVFVAPVANTQRLYSETILDNESNTTTVGGGGALVTCNL